MIKAKQFVFIQLSFLIITVMTNKITSFIASICLIMGCTVENNPIPELTNDVTTSPKVTLIAGSFTETGNVDNANPLDARFLRLGKLTWDDRNKTLYVLDGATTSNLRKINQAGVSTIAKAALGVFNEGFDICLAPDGAGYLYVTSSLGQLLKVNSMINFDSSNPKPIIDWVKADGSRKLDENKTGSLDESAISGPYGLATVPDGKIYFSNSYFLTIHEVNLKNIGKEVSEFAGKPTSGVSASAYPFADGIGNNACFGGIHDMDEDQNGNIYVADEGYKTVRKITPNGQVSSFLTPSPNTHTYYDNIDGTLTTARSGKIKHVAVSKDGSIIYFATFGVLRAIIPAKNKVLTIVKFKDDINGITTTPDGKEVYFSSNSGVYKVSDVKF
jgi:hypothetical protein